MKGYISFYATAIAVEAIMADIRAMAQSQLVVLGGPAELAWALDCVKRQDGEVQILASLRFENASDLGIRSSALWEGALLRDAALAAGAQHVAVALETGDGRFIADVTEDGVKIFEHKAETPWVEEFDDCPF